MQTTDPYLKKNICFRYQEHDLRFNISQALFSSQDIDVGTKHLLRTMTEEGFQTYGKVLDLGCGYGPIGISLKVSDPTSEIQMVDKDALALQYTKENAAINKTSDIQIFGSLGYDDVKDRDFDLIVSNVPAKVGNEVLSHILLDARYHLKPKGKVVVVVIDAIGEYVFSVLQNSNTKILFHKRWPGHLVFHYQFLSVERSSDSDKHMSFESGLYDRGEKQIVINDLALTLKTTYNLPEFDTLSFETELLLSNLKKVNGKKISHAIVFNPGQGFIPVALEKIASVEKLTLIDRDLQALRSSKRNLILNGYSHEKIHMSHQVGLLEEVKENADCILGILSEKDSPEVHAMFLHQAANRLAEDGVIFLSSNSTAITRIATLVKLEKQLSIRERQKLKGRSLLVLQKRVLK